MIEVVKSYAKHEKDVFEKVTELRSISYKQIPNKQKLNINKIMQEEISKIFGVVENYPILKADRNFLELNEQLVKIEEEIENSRKYYKAVVCEYNTNVECFPLNIFAYIFNFKK